MNNKKNLFYFILLVSIIQTELKVTAQNFTPTREIILSDTNFILRTVRNSPVSIEADPFGVNRNSSVAPANDNCGSATALTVNGSCINGSTENGTTQGSEVTTPSCVASAFTQTVWYSFVATNSNMYVNINLTSFGGSGALWSPTQWACAVYRATGCPPAAGSLVSCKNSNSQGTGDGAIVNIMTGLLVGQTYYIQIGYRTGMGVNQIPNFCIRVGDQFTPQCNTCSNPCGAAYGFVTPPTTAQVTANPGFPQTPYIEGAQADTQCYTFTAINDSVDFNVIVNSTCSGGNVTGFTWSLYQTGSCGSTVQTGTLSNLKLTGLAIGTSYTYCYSFTVPTDCYHTAYWPYFVGAAPLPVEMLNFEAVMSDNFVEVKWATASETNSDYFRLEKSFDGREFFFLKDFEAAHNSTNVKNYEFSDVAGQSKISYYRLIQFDFDGQNETFGPIAVKLKPTSEPLKLYSTGFSSDDNLNIDFSTRNAGKVNLNIVDSYGKTIYAQILSAEAGLNTFSVPIKISSGSLYFISISNDSSRSTLKAFK